MPTADYLKFEERALKLAIDTGDDMLWCFTPDCKNAFVMNPSVRYFECEVCGQVFCLKCNYPRHPGQTCAESKVNNQHGENDDKFLEYANTNALKQCTKCNFWVERN